MSDEKTLSSPLVLFRQTYYSGVRRNNPRAARNPLPDRHAGDRTQRAGTRVGQTPGATGGAHHDLLGRRVLDHKIPSPTQEGTGDAVPFCRREVMSCPIARRLPSPCCFGSSS